MTYLLKQLVVSVRALAETLHALEVPACRVAIAIVFFTHLFHFLSGVVAAPSNVERRLDVLERRLESVDTDRPRQNARPPRCNAEHSASRPSPTRSIGRAPERTPHRCVCGPGRAPQPVKESR